MAASVVELHSVRHMILVFDYGNINRRVRQTAELLDTIGLAPGHGKAVRMAHSMGRPRRALADETRARRYSRPAPRDARHTECRLSLADGAGLAVGALEIAWPLGLFGDFVHAVEKADVMLSACTLPDGRAARLRLSEVACDHMSFFAAGQWALSEAMGRR